MTEVEFRQQILAELEAVHRLACHLTRAGPESDDCVQETYLRALRSRETFTLGPLGVRPWLFKILHNVIHGRGAKARRERDVLEDLLNDADPSSARAADDEALCPPDAVAGRSIDWEQIDERLKLAIAGLPVAFREAFLLSAVEGLKYREIAEVLEVPIGTVTSRLARARTMLAARLADLAAERRLDAPDAQPASAATRAHLDAARADVGATRADGGAGGSAAGGDVA